MSSSFNKINSKIKTLSITYSKQIKLAFVFVLILFIVILIIINNSKLYPDFKINTNVKNNDINNYYENTFVVYVNLNDLAEEYIIENGGTYHFTGESTNRIIINETNQKVYLCFNDVKINSLDVCIINYNNKNTIINVNGTNELTSNSDYQLNDELIDACIYSKNDLIINGTGTLKITSSNNGIKASDNLVICNSTLNITSSKAGINVNEGLDLYNANITLDCLFDGIHSGNLNEDKTFVTIFNSNIDITTCGDGIDSTGLIGIQSGNIKINTSYKYSFLSASQVGLKSTKGIVINNGTIIIDSYDHGIQSSIFEIFGGSLEIATENDAIHVSEYLVIDGGITSINAYDDALHSDDCVFIKNGETTVESCYEGIEGINIYISGGITKIKSSDDGINVSCEPNENMNMGMMGQSYSDKPKNGVLKITGGILYVNASGDGLDSNDKIVMTGGIVLVDGPTDNGNGALDYDTTCKITGGTLIACGSTGMAQSATGGECGGLYTINGSANTTFLITDSNENLILAYTPSKTYQCIAISSNLLKKNKTYNIYLGATVTGEDSLGLITNGTIENYGSLSQSFTAKVPSSTNNMGGFNGGGAGPGGQGPGGQGPGGGQGGFGGR